MGRHGAKKKGGWRQHKRRRQVSERPVGRPVVPRAEKKANFENHKQLAEALWSTDYDVLMLSSLETCPLLKAALQQFVAQNDSRHHKEMKPRQQRENECNAFFSHVMTLCSKFVGIETLFIFHCFHCQLPYLHTTFQTLMTQTVLIPLDLTLYMCNPSVRTVV